uniref:(northern house mosquito) hypothetical protein n=1 Tax=Culex pipiens TaxID=7175 RepID=A0A8D8H3X8_CULPI
MWLAYSSSMLLLLSRDILKINSRLVTVNWQWRRFNWKLETGKLDHKFKTNNSGQIFPLIFGRAMISTAATDIPEAQHLHLPTTNGHRHPSNSLPCAKRSEHRSSTPPSSIQIAAVSFLPQTSPPNVDDPLHSLSLPFV